MNPTELEGHTIVSLGRLIETRKLSPVELTSAVVRRIERLNPALNAYITVTADQAVEDARAAESEIAKGSLRGPLHGIPVGYKDVLLTAGIRTTAHSSLLRDFVPDISATVVARLQAAGCVGTGKLNTYEFACGGTETFGVPVNPWDCSCTTGGSSAGAGAAVAASLCLGAVGTDTGGSIRAPSSYCGVVGLKPTAGLVSRHGVLPLSWSLDYAGPMTKTAVDAAILLDAIAGFDPLDPTTRSRANTSYAQAVGGANLVDVPEVKGLTVGVPRAFFEAPVAPGVAAVVERALDELARLGARLIPVDLPFAGHSMTAIFAIMSPEATAVHARRLRTAALEYARYTRHSVMLGATLSGLDYIRAQQVRREMFYELETALREVDALAWPTTHRTAPPVDEPEVWAAVQTQLTNLTGHPSVSVPCGFSGGLPVGLHITGRPFDEVTILRLAAAYQGATEWVDIGPNVPQDNRPPTTKPYGFASFAPDVGAQERAAFTDHVVRSLRQYDLPVIEEDIEALAALSASITAGIALLGTNFADGSEPFSPALIR